MKPALLEPLPDAWRAVGRHPIAPIPGSRRRGGEKVADFLLGGGAAGDGGLPDQEPKSGIGGKCAEEHHFVSEEFVVEGPALQIVDGGSLRFLVRAMDDEKTEEIRLKSP